MIDNWHLYLMCGLYISAGVVHFLRPKMYMRIMPRYLPAHKTLVYASGAFEILMGLFLIFESTRTIGLIGIIAMLMAFLLVHFYMLSSEKAGAGFPKWLLVSRIPIQFLLMYWAYIYL